ncbi:bifunctional glycosyltransferase/CDP-glycerol:glycerophosphate glycerophosphotransferase [Peribacillus kribbensis]|uniref:bifunctional glycosyltransferase/CDP-glycerol:glycerophosphate glycerophosphotransferase n=1 Tax=Peribacillus kribbensis TaxID=356658 RepID=UPI0003F7E219|nr:bifunctional glycosyltransferase family 2 protein/CDP-glycerol:glycerophosphate glycerophosphotransferase [Peribacillus kribbensis]
MTNSMNINQKPPKLSVVVIAYNNELYIEEALESLHEQTFEDMEVCVVNDFSTDATGELIDKFVADKPKFKAVHLKENSGGCSTPRNTGIAHTTGEYVMFLDGDDWYTIDACEKMVAAIERTGSDFVGGQVIRTNNYEIWYQRQIYNMERTNINIREFSMMLFDSLSVNKIYKRSFLDQNQLRFPEGIHYEDIVFTGKAYFLADSFSIIPEPVYYWRVVENADVKSITNRRFEFDNFKNRIVAHRLFDAFLREHGDILYQANKNNKFLRHDLKLYTNDYLEFDEDYKNKFHELIYEYMHEVMDAYAFIRLPEKERIMYYLLYIGDKQGFQDFLSYKEHLPTSIPRVYSKGGSYYFKTTAEGRNHEKFLKMENLEFSVSIDSLELTQDALTFDWNATMESITNSEAYYSWMLKNRQTGAVIYSRQTSGGKALLPLNHVVPGNYYLFLNVSHQGNLHRYLVKKPVIAHLPNLRVKDSTYSRQLFINNKNSFAVKVAPLKKKDQAAWMLNKRKAASKEPGILEKVFSPYAKNFFKKLSVKPNWVLFESHMGKQYSDSPKYIYEEMRKSHPQYKFIWSFENPDAVEVPGNVVKVKRRSLKHYYYLVRSKFWVDNQGIAHLTRKKKDQVYVQTWHGTPLKRMGYDQKKLPSDEELAKLRVQTNAWDYFVSPNPYSTEIFKRAFRYGGEIIESGYPRNDIVIQKPQDVIQKVKNHFRLSPEKKVVLFAPTFRDWDPNSFQKTLRDIQTLSQSVSEDTVVLLRLHYLLSERIGSKDLPSNIKNASTYQDIQELYLIADSLVTDYSSVMFDYALLERPIILYTYDLEEYLSRRGTYFDLVEKAPGPVCRSIEEVIAFINDPQKLQAFDPALHSFAEEFGSIEDGHAAQKVIERVFK